MRKLLIISSLLFLLNSSINILPNRSSDSRTSNISTSLNDKENNFPKTINIKDIAQNPEGIEFNKNDNTFLLSSLNAGPILKVNLDGTYKPFTSGEQFPMSSAGLQIDYKNNRLLVASFNAMELYDKNPKTKGISNLRIYDLKSGVLKKDIHLSSLAPDAEAYFANDIAVDKKANAYITDWYASIVYKVDIDGNASVFWKNETGIPSSPNGIDVHPDGFLLVSILKVNEKGLYADYGLVKVPLNNPKAAQTVKFENSGFTGFDGMVINAKGNAIGVTNDGKTPGGNTLMELSSKDGWKSAKVVNSKSIKASTTVAITPKKMNYVINQDFSNNDAKNWTIERIEF